MAEPVNEVMRHLAERWTEPLVQILESMTDQKPKVDWKVAAAAEGEGIFWWEQRLNLDQTPLIWVGAPSETWNDLGERTLRAAGIDVVESADAKNTYLEILNQSLAGLVQSLSEWIGSEVTCVKGDECAQPAAEASWIAVEIHYDDATLAMSIGFAANLIARIGQPADTELEPPSEAITKPGEMEPDDQMGLLPHSSKTLGLLLDVELPVSVSFGRAELLLKDVMKLTTGSIVELNRGITEPVEVIVNNCVVARGEVVVMDGNYGVRIHQIISPKERLRTLK